MQSGTRMNFNQFLAAITYIWKAMLKALEYLHSAVSKMYKYIPALIPSFLAWCGGYNFDARNIDAFFLALVSVVIIIIIHLKPKHFQ